MNNTEQRLIHILTSPLDGPIKVLPYPEILKACEGAYRNPNHVRATLRRFEARGYAARLDNDSYCLTM